MARRGDGISAAMATVITSECINCGACEPECPNTAIYQGGVEWQAPDGAMHPAISNDIFYIVPEKCTECVGFFDHEACAAVCPVDCCVPDPNRPESHDALLARARTLHPEQTIADDAPRRYLALAESGRVVVLRDLGLEVLVVGVELHGALDQDRLGFRVIRVRKAALDRTDRLTLLVVEEADALGAGLRVDDVDLIALADRVVGALRLAGPAIDAFFRDVGGHGPLWRARGRPSFSVGAAWGQSNDTTSAARFSQKDALQLLPSP